MMLEQLNPEYRFSSILNIKPAWMRGEGYEALLLDVDNTLLPRNSARIPAEHLVWLKGMRQAGIAVALSSNNGGTRVQLIKKQLLENGLDIPILTWAGKPAPWAYTKALRLLQGKEEKDASAGRDSLFEEKKEKVTLARPMCNREANEKAITQERHIQVLAAGDQLFTDVLGAHLSGIPAVWLRPLSPNDFVGTKILRLLEMQVSHYLDKNELLPKEDKEVRSEINEI